MELSKALINKLRRKLPELCSVKDLLKIGVYRSEQAAYEARRNGKSPEFFRLPYRGIVYPRDGIIEFLKSAAANLTTESRIRNAVISHSEVSPVTQKSKNMSEYHEK